MLYGKQAKACGSGDPLLLSAMHKLPYGLLFAVISGCFALLLSSATLGRLPSLYIGSIKMSPVPVIQALILLLKSPLTRENLFILSTR